MKILIVDDQEEYRGLLRFTLQAEKFETLEAADGLEALEALKTAVPDAVISDILMPNMDGYSLCRAVRADAALKNIPFILYSATYVSPADEKIAAECGADRYISKPAVGASIIEAVRALTSAAPAKRRSAPLAPSEREVLKQYNELLVRKLEEKTLELRERNATLEVSEEHFRQLIENLEQVLILQEAGRGRLLYVSRAYASIWGRTLESLLAAPNSWLDAVVPEDSAAVRAMVEKEPDGSVHEFRIVRPDRTIRWIRSREFPIRNKDGAIIRHCGIFEDVTALKTAEGQLRQAQKMESIGRLAGGVAHDFNNVLTAISGYAQFLVARLDSGDPRREDAQEIVKSVKRAAALTSQLLAFSRKQALKPKVLSLNDVVAGFDKMLRRLIGEDIRVETSLAPDLGMCKADPGQLEQILMNLAVNARDAMPLGGLLRIETADVVLTEEGARAQADARPGPHVRLMITDTGTGMSADVLSHLFEPFFTTKAVHKGTGLGLATAYGIVRQSEGHVEVESKLGRGTSVRIYLPRVAAAADQAPPATPPAVRKGTGTILLVEDDDAVRPVTRRMLAELGYAVLAARDGLEAFSIAEKHSGPIDLALIDMVMPGANGPEVIACLRERHPKLRILCMSGYVDHDVLRRGIDVSALFLQKPFTRQSLAEAVAESLSGAAT